MEHANSIMAEQIALAARAFEHKTGTVVHVFTTGTMVQVFLLAHGIPADTWSGSGTVDQT